MKIYLFATIGVAVGLLSASPASAQETLCDASSADCRTPLMNLINNERVGIDVGVWFFKDDRYVQALVRAKQRGVRVRVLMDPRANANYPTNAFELDRLKNAGIAMRRRTAGDILHWKLMIFDGQGVVEWSGANYSPVAFVPQDPYKDYEDEVIFFSKQLLDSFMTIFDDTWTNTTDYANYANISEPLTRAHPTSAIDPRLNFPPRDSYQNRLIPLIDREPRGGLIDVDMYRITIARPVDALIRAAARGVRLRLYLEPNEYANTARPGNKVQMDRLVAAAKQYPGTIEIRMRAHLGLNHQKTVWLHTQKIVVFGTSNWSDASDDNQLEANIFTDKNPNPGDGLNDLLFNELHQIFLRKWYNTSPIGATETVAWRTPTLPPPDGADRCANSAASNYGGPAPCVYSGAGGAGTVGTGTVVLWSSKVPAADRHGNWQRQSDTIAAGGSTLWNPDAGQAKIGTALAGPANYFETTFTASAGKAYHLWVRMKAQGNGYANDSIHVQFSDSVTATGAATMRIGTAGSAAVVLQAGDSGAQPQGWGWADNGWNALGSSIYFAASGTHRVRIQQREDGALVDQIVLSPDTWLTTAPGTRRNDTKILAANDGSGGGAGDNGTCNDSSATNFGGPLPCVYPPPPGGGGGSLLGAGDVLLHPAAATVIVGNWVRQTDATAATGASLLNANLNAAKVSTALAAPPDYFEITFQAIAGTAYRLWIRSKATADSWTNDSVHIQFDDSVDSGGAPKYRIGTTDATWYTLEECSNCGLSGWGWQDNGFGLNVAGPLIYFATTGTHTIRVQPRTDGLAIDQILLSPEKFKTQSPGANRNDTTILQ
jgi:phosphatidylserine/phosphatidylglycerophosphate/cardiolipin synthase-like enzyme